MSFEKFEKVPKMELEKVEEMEEKESPEELGEKTAELVKKIYKKVSPEIGVRLVESNIVLTLAGHKGFTDFCFELSQKENLQKREIRNLKKGIEEMNEVLKETAPEIKFFLREEIIESRGRKLISGSVYNLRAVEELSKRTKIPGITPYDKSTGIEGLKEWSKKNLENLKKMQEIGQIPKGFDVEHILAGIQLGYPDRAIYDLCDSLITGRKDLKEANILYQDKYSAALPSFDFYPESESNEEIQENIRVAGEILRGFYESDWHKEIEKDPNFIKFRAPLDQKMVKEKNQNQ